MSYLGTSCKVPTEPAQVFQLRKTSFSKQQETTELVTECADDVCNLCHRLNIDIDRQLHYFIQGLRQSLKKHVLRRHTRNIGEAIQFAKAEEAAQRVDETKIIPLSLRKPQKHRLTSCRAGDGEIIWPRLAQITCHRVLGTSHIPQRTWRDANYATASRILHQTVRCFFQ